MAAGGGGVDWVARVIALAALILGPGWGIWRWWRDEHWKRPRVIVRPEIEGRDPTVTITNPTRGRPLEVVRVDLCRVTGRERLRPWRPSIAPVKKTKLPALVVLPQRSETAGLPGGTDWIRDDQEWLAQVVTADHQVFSSEVLRGRPSAWTGS